MNIRELSDEQIRLMITCPKAATNTPRLSTDYRHQKKNYCLQAADYPAYEFSLFYRQSMEENDDYSVGLLVNFPNGSKPLTLIRFNGSSHCHPNKLENTVIEWQTHIHTATVRYIHIGRPDGYAEATEQYQCAEEALQYAVRYCNITGIGTPNPNGGLFSDGLP